MYKMLKKKTIRLQKYRVSTWWIFGNHWHDLPYWITVFSYCNYFCIHLYESESEVTQSCLTLCDPMDCSLPGFPVHGVFQARVLEWVAISFSRGSFWPRDRTQVSCIAGRCFTLWATREYYITIGLSKSCLWISPKR